MSPICKGWVEVARAPHPPQSPIHLERQLIDDYGLLTQLSYLATELCNH